MLILDHETIIAINSDGVRSLKLFDVEYIDKTSGLIATKRLTDNNEEVLFEGATYDPFAIKIGDITQTTSGKTESVTLSVGNIDEERIIQRVIEDNEIIGQNVTVYEFFADIDTGALFPTPIVNTFKIGGAVANQGQVDFSLSLGFDFLTAKLPARKFFAKFCRWRNFKDSLCKYSGPDVECGRSWDDCKAKGNVLNFGGTPAINNSRIYF